jgi:hypothetical protein
MYMYVHEPYTHHELSGRGNLECCKILLQYGAYPAPFDEDKMSPAARARELKPLEWSAIETGFIFLFARTGASTRGV